MQITINNDEIENVIKLYISQKLDKIIKQSMTERVYMSVSKRVETRLDDFDFDNAILKSIENILKEYGVRDLIKTHKIITTKQTK